MKLTTKGQVTIPLEVRKRLGLRPGGEVEFVMRGDDVVLRKRPSGRSAGLALVEHMQAAGRRARIRLTTDQIMALTRGE